MLKTEDFIRTFPVNFKSDRDCENPVLLEFIKSKTDIESLLDVGAHFSGNHYMGDIRPLVKVYDGIDIQLPHQKDTLLDRYHVGNFRDFPFAAPYDAVICVSTIEHSGVSTYKGIPRVEQDAVFRKCLSLARKYLWISFPVGQPFLYENELSVITDEILDGWLEIADGLKVIQRFFYNQGPQANHPWHEHSKRDVAMKIPYIHYIGNQSICVLEIEK